MKKTVLALSIAATLSSVAMAEEQAKGNLPYTLQPKSPESTASQPYRRFESDRSQQQPSDSCKEEKGYYLQFETGFGSGSGIPPYGGGYGGIGKRR